jgi:ribosome maturation factor RimP
MESRIRELVAPIAEELGVEVLRVRLGGGQRTHLVQIIVDRRGGVDSEALERISRGVSLQMDAEDLIPGAYRLEVSSPGFDWPLQSPADFVRYGGDWLKVDMADGRAVEGYNRGLEGEELLLEDADGQILRVDRQQTVRVVRAINWKDLARGKA